MFNAPRRMGGSLSSSAFVSPNPNAASSFDPLAQSMPPPTYGEVDPWSTVPSPAPSGTPRRESEEVVAPVNGGYSGKASLDALINDPPPLYVSIYDNLNSSPAGTVTLPSLHRTLATSSLPASTIERIVNLTSRDGSTFTRNEVFCALALVALAQSSSSDAEDLSIEKLAEILPNLSLPSLNIPASPIVETTRAVPPESPNVSPWDTAPRINGKPSFDNGPNGDADGGFGVPATASVVQGDQSQKGYWKKLETVEVNLVAQKEGWFLQKYTIESDKRSSGPLARRYSDFVWLLDCLTKRYPFRLLPSLPPKRIGPDAHFLEQRRKGLKRFLNMLVNHPVTQSDGALNVFLTESQFESWRKRTSVSVEEESTSKRLSSAEEMSLPVDLDERLTKLRSSLPGLVAYYQKLVVLAERNLSRLVAVSADCSRFALALGGVGEGIEGCCHLSEADQGCGLCRGVGRGLGEVGETWSRIAEESEKRSTAVMMGSVEMLKTQRDLYVAFRDLFVRYDKLSKDNVDALKKKVEGRQKKIETFKSSQKPGWEVEVDKLVSANDQDNSTVTGLLSRRVFIKACMWHELSVVFHSRQAAQATLGWRDWARQEADSTKGIRGIWEGLSERLDGMPVE